MEQLPKDIIFIIFQYLDDNDIFNIPLLNNHFNKLANHPIIWRNRTAKWICNTHIHKQEDNIKDIVVSKSKYLSILRQWPKKINKPYIVDVKEFTNECLCIYHIYNGTIKLPCNSYIPLEALQFLKYPLFNFWFNENHQLALPVVAINYHQLLIDLT